MKTAVMAIGMPGAGKTTVLKPLAERYGFAYISRDDVREEFTGDARDQSRNREVWAEANRRTADALARGMPVVLDSTFVEKRKRREMIAFLRLIGVDRIVGIYFDVPLEIAKARNEARDRTVPPAVMEWMHETLSEEGPSAEEGFDEIVRAEDAELERVFMPGA